MRFKCQKHIIETSNENKKLFLPSSVTKGDLIQYYCRIAQFMLPYTKNHAVTMVRYPNGITGEGFYQKDTPDYFPDWIRRVSIPKQEGGMTKYVIINNADTLPYLANQGCITPHLWLSRIEKLDYPDRMIFDLDPGEQPFSCVQKTALQLKMVLEACDLPVFAMTTGSAGIHVYVPLNRRSTFNEVRGFAQSIAKILIADNPKQLTLEVRIEKRKGRMFIDTLRNTFGATGVAPYGVRPKPNAPVATPLAWSEVGNKALTPQKYTIDNIFKRLDAKGEVWHDFFKIAGSITRASKKLERLKP